jgi:hypothetical protein
LAATAEAPRKREDSPAIPFVGSRPVPDGTLAIEPNAEMGQTAPLSRPRPRAPATPFEPAEPTLAPSAASPAVVVAPPPATRGRALEPARLLAETADVHSVREPPLPFRGRAAAPPSALDDLEPNASMGETTTLVDQSQPIALEPDRALGSTLDGAAPAAGAALPFAGKSKAPPKVAALEPVVALGSTMPVSSPPRAPATPFEAPRSPASWSAEDYGRFCAAVESAGERYTEVLKAFGVRSKNQHEHLAAMWRARLQADEQTLARFLAGKRSAGDR